VKPKIGTRVRYVHATPCLPCSPWTACDGVLHSGKEGNVSLHADASSEGRIHFSFQVRVDFPDGAYVWTDARKLEEGSIR